jgi:hypothetical protein
MGIGDALAEQRNIGGDYSLGEFEDGRFYLWARGQSSDVAGPISKVAWDTEFIIVNSPLPNSKWMIIRIKDHKILVGAEKIEVERGLLGTLHLLTPSEAWERARQRQRR